MNVLSASSILIKLSLDLRWTRTVEFKYISIILLWQTLHNTITISVLYNINVITQRIGLLENKPNCWSSQFHFT